ncbi:killer cell lectin-like receptor subfamily B member 1B allele B [Ciconia boyciana]|uniref:killer cell lectin-like receptor subfamily B member 1B allele B n=1 Tax=Ciconia boyciana TaxID=52775 RepID=UPI003BA1DAD5
MEDEDGYMVLGKRGAAGSPGPLQDAGAPHHPRFVLGVLMATLVLSLMVCEGEGCKLCPMGWTLHGTKCYWVANEMNPWDQSKQDCVNRGAELLMPGDQEELRFLNEILQKPSRYFWIGLSIPSAGKGWTWLNGSRLDQSRFQVSPGDKGRSCGMLREDRISSDNCSSALQWICQKEATQL